jgi:hypothetical protein
MKKSLITCLLGVALVGFTPTTPLLRADDHKKTWHDNERNEDHEWNDREDRAYRMYVKEHHRKYKDFGKLKEDERQEYWRWRHEHNDTVLKLDIH